MMKKWYVDVIVGTRKDGTNIPLYIVGRKGYYSVDVYGDETLRTFDCGGTGPSRDVRVQGKEFTLCCENKRRFFLVRA